ncbi:Holliday junction branch migration protein RuvA [Pseudobacter ginsenosidimutans]|uniref:Holliday junction branch migration complex subunit RuvA n=1 Tax=Pseudobacter ginsenosidimutans TaxID=661488 RepID=A0A4Q7MMK9_9BACT|nr:Holliday junction branch migration protein RuvA [Pseudobacter ginsenosidimutans]QEC40477.1 Holliday junction branch migration protein RuvA [Pseudobacter ginsenosidimutans]RZS68913.1 Holliday junction DNA helicase subunit RuvA [Pseudobacter ginsenosidimutans]
MIAFIRGNFVHKSPAVVQVEANGVGYELQISLNTYSAIQGLEKGLLYTHLAIREDAHVLYGFSDTVEKELFLQLISVSGVGAATARMMLSSVKPEEIVRAIAEANTKLLESIKGIGKKSAERIVLELKDKMAKSRLDANIPSASYNPTGQDALNALMALGIARAAGEQAIQKVLKAEPGLSVVEDIIKKALKTL